MDLRMRMGIIIEQNRDDIEQAVEEIFEMLQSEGIIDADFEEEVDGDDYDY